MDQRQLRYFVKILETGSLSRAAEVLFVAQPALSAQMRNLEAELGVPLLVRSSRGMTATRHGELLKHHALSILRQFEQARHEVIALGTEPAGEVALGVPASLSAILVQPLLAAIQTDTPRITPRIVEAMSGHLLEWLHSGRLDIAILFDTQPNQALHTHLLPADDLFLVGHPHAFSAGENILMADLSRYPLILPGAMHGGSQLIRNTAGRLGVALNIRVEVDAVGEMIGLIEQGFGYTPMAPVGFLRRLDEGKVSVARIVKPRLQRQLVLATAAVRPVSAATEVVLKQAEHILQTAINKAAGRKELRSKKAT